MAQHRESGRGIDALNAAIAEAGHQQQCYKLACVEQGRNRACHGSIANQHHAGNSQRRQQQ
jgi:hypothetical protein